MALLLRWNGTINLIGRADADPESVWDRHVANSLRLLPLMPPGAMAATDLGSGAGLPGLVLAVATGVPFALVEADRRKAAFLAEAARVTAAPVTVHCARIEAVRLGPAPLVTARALASLPRLLGYAAPLARARRHLPVPERGGRGGRGRRRASPGLALHPGAPRRPGDP